MGTKPTEHAKGNNVCVTNPKVTGLKPTSKIYRFCRAFTQITNGGHPRKKSRHPAPVISTMELRDMAKGGGSGENVAVFLREEKESLLPRILKPAGRRKREKNYLDRGTGFAAGTEKADLERTRKVRLTAFLLTKKQGRP